MILFGLVALILALICYELFGSGESKEPPRCGDGRLNALNEQCDDGNDNEADSCNNKCQRTKDLCGNGKIDSPLEECDDGGNTPGDGCGATCKKEAKYGRCGNGRVEPGEECDDANDDELDGCDSLCRKSVIAGGKVPELCGNGQIDAGEGCDDGNNVNGDGCSRDCQPTKMGPWYTKECDRCMEESCKEDSNMCKGDSDCLDAFSCAMENACLSLRTGPANCYCGAQSIMNCREPGNPPLGACVKQVHASFGVRTKEQVFDNFLNQDYAMGRAHKTQVCMTRHCKKSCTFMFGGATSAM